MIAREESSSKLRRVRQLPVRTNRRVFTAFLSATPPLPGTISMETPLRPELFPQEASGRFSITLTIELEDDSINGRGAACIVSEGCPVLKMLSINLVSKLAWSGPSLLFFIKCGFEAEALSSPLKHSNGWPMALIREEAILLSIGTTTPSKPLRKHARLEANTGAMEDNSLFLFEPPPPRKDARW